jgi:hypothetical protein
VKGDGERLTPAVGMPQRSPIAAKAGAARRGTARRENFIFCLEF